MPEDKAASYAPAPPTAAPADPKRERANRLARAIGKTATDLGVDAGDVGTAISYETGGTFDPWKRGPTTRYGQHRGLIQWGEPQRRKYGVTADSSVEQQMEGVTRYLRDAGVRPGHGLKDIYSAINAGRVGRYGARDAAAGGAPGTVADKVAGMGAHRRLANRLLSGGGVAGADSRKDGDGPAAGSRGRSGRAQVPRNGSRPLAGRSGGFAGARLQLAAADGAPIHTTGSPMARVNDALDAALAQIRPQVEAAAALTRAVQRTSFIDT